MHFFQIGGEIIERFYKNWTIIQMLFSQKALNIILLESKISETEGRLELQIIFLDHRRYYFLKVTSKIQQNGEKH